MRVLLAEDDQGLRFLYEIWLRAEGYDVDAVADGRAALESIDARGIPDAAVLDIGMPEVDGITVCRRLRMLGARVPVIVQTANHHELAADAAAAGADLVLPKPATYVDLVRPLASLLGARRAAA